MGELRKKLHEKKQATELQLQTQNCIFIQFSVEIFAKISLSPTT